MNRSRPIRHCASLLAAGALALSCIPGLADEAAPPAPEPMSGHGRSFDWIRHTQHTLDELKVKLNLAPAQLAAWDAWSGGVMKDAHAQLEKRKPWLEEGGPGGKPMAEVTTPERMAQGIERLRAETAWMQEHLAQLEAAQARTKTFYDALDTNQKTIFDLFWHEIDHRLGGSHGGAPMNRHEGFGPCGP